MKIWETINQLIMTLQGNKTTHGGAHSGTLQKLRQYCNHPITFLIINFVLVYIIGATA